MALFLGEIKEGKLIYKNPQFVDDFLKHIKDYPQVLVKIEKKRNIRSKEHNAYYWGYIINEIVSITGQPGNSAHYYLKQMFCPKKFIKFGDKEVEAEPHTSNMNSLEFSEFIDKVKLWGIENYNIAWMDESDYLSVK